MQATVTETTRPMDREKTQLLWDLARANDQIRELQEHVAIVDSLAKSLAMRVAAQAEMLGRSTESRGESFERVKELEGALAPFAEVLANGWDDGTLSARAMYPVQMGDLRRAARVYAGTAHERR